MIPAGRRRIRPAAARTAGSFGLAVLFNSNSYVFSRFQLKFRGAYAKPPSRTSAVLDILESASAAAPGASPGSEARESEGCSRCSCGTKPARPGCSAWANASLHRIWPCAAAASSATTSSSESPNSWYRGRFAGQIPATIGPTWRPTRCTTGAPDPSGSKMAAQADCTSRAKRASAAAFWCRVRPSPATAPVVAMYASPCQCAQDSRLVSGSDECNSIDKSVGQKARGRETRTHHSLYFGHAMLGRNFIKPREHPVKEAAKLLRRDPRAQSRETHLMHQAAPGANLEMSACFFKQRLSAPSGWVGGGSCQVRLEDARARKVPRQRLDVFVRGLFAATLCL